MPETLLVEKKGAVVTLTLNQPQNRNAMSHRMAEEFQEAVGQIGRDPSCRFLILTGSGASFCSGADFDTVVKDLELPAERYKDRIRHFYSQFLCLRDLSIPTLAAVNGHAVGAGFCLALGCDMRMASTSALFGMSFIRLGLHPGMGGTYFLPRMVGTARAFEILLTGKEISAQEAFAMGLLNRVVAPEELLPAAEDLARRICSLPQLPIRYMKRSIYMGIRSELTDMLEHESFAQALCIGTEDREEGVAAFREKRKPRFG